MEFDSEISLVNVDPTQGNLKVDLVLYRRGLFECLLWYAVDFEIIIISNDFVDVGVW